MRASDRDIPRTKSYTPETEEYCMKRRGFIKTATAAVVGLSGCLGGGDSGNEQQEVENEPQGRFTVVRDARRSEVEITVDDPMNSDHAAIDGDINYTASLVMENISQGDSITLSVENGDISASGTLEIFAIQGEIMTTEENKRTLLEEIPEKFTSIQDDDNPFSYDFSEDE